MTITMSERSQSIIAALDPEDLEGYLHYLDALRESGVVNMFGARPYLMEAFNLKASTASAVLAHWMSTFTARHAQEAR